MSKKDAPIIIKKIKKGGHGGHHGGAWKIAYADFVTAMMAFFLLMWLLNATSEEQRRGIANYFDPFAAETKGGGNMGVMGGTSVKEKDGTLEDKSTRISLHPTPLSEKGAGGTAAGVAKNQDEHASDNGGTTEEEKAKNMARKDIEDKLMKQSPAKNQKFDSKQAEEKALNSISENIKKVIEANPELKKLGDHIRMEMTAEGLKISVIDQIKTAMFPSGSSRMYQQMDDILRVIATAIKDVPNKITITGHTDGAQYRQGAIFSNWELSAERANATRRILSQDGVNDNRYESVSGKADRELFDPKHPDNPQNRRVAITLLREFKEKGGATSGKGGVTGGPQTASQPVASPLPQPKK